MHRQLSKLVAKADRCGQIAVAVLLSACATVPPPEPPPEPPRAKAVQVWSNPPGCVVELNGDVVGITPCWVMVPTTQSGRWQETTRVYVSPFAGAGVPDIRLFWAGDRVPSVMFFRPICSEPQPVVPRLAALR